MPFIENIQPTYRQYPNVTQFQSLTTLRNIGMVVEDELARKTSIKARNASKGNDQNRDKKTKAPQVRRYLLQIGIEYIPIGTAHEGKEPDGLA